MPSPAVTAPGRRRFLPVSDPSTLVRVALALLVLGVAALATVFGLRDVYHWADEGIAVYGGRQIQADFPNALWQWDFSFRPLERLTAWEYALADTVAGSTTDGFRLAHGFQAVLWALAAPLVYGLGRRTGLTQLAALLAAALAVIGPWLVIPLSLLNNAPGFVTFCLLLWAMWQALVRPSWRADVLVLAAVVLTGMARFGNAPLVLAIVPVIAILAVTDARREGGRWLLRVPALVLRRHPVLCAAAAIALLTIVARSSSTILGSYGGVRTSSFPWQLVDDNARLLSTHLMLAVGVSAALLAVAWLLCEVVRPRARESWVFALLAVFVVLVFNYTYSGSINEDRYFVVLAPLIAIAIGHALSDRRPSIVAVVAVSLVGAWLLDTSVGVPGNKDSFYIAASTQGWSGPVLGHLSTLPVVGPHASLVAAITAAGIAVAIAAIMRYAPPRVRIGAIGLFVVGVLAYQLASAVYVMDNWTSRAAPNVGSLAAATWIDSAGPEPTLVAVQNPSGDPIRGFSLEEQAFWNESVVGSISLRRKNDWACCRGPVTPLRVDPDDGTVSPAISPARLVTSTDPDAGFVGNVLRRSSAWQLRLEQPRGPLRLSYLVRPRQRGEALRLRAFPRTVGRKTCLVGALGPGAAPGGRWTWQVGDRRVPLKGPFSIRLPDAQRTTIRLLGPRPPASPAAPNGAPVVSDLRVTGCG